MRHAPDEFRLSRRASAFTIFLLSISMWHAVYQISQQIF